MTIFTPKILPRAKLVFGPHSSRGGEVRVKKFPVIRGRKLFNLYSLVICWTFRTLDNQEFYFPYCH